VLFRRALRSGPVTARAAAALLALASIPLGLVSALAQLLALVALLAATLLAEAALTRLNGLTGG